MKKEDYGYFVAQEDTNVYNVFAFDEFNDNGFLEGYDGEDGYNLQDFDIVGMFEDFNDANEWVEQHS